MARSTATQARASRLALIPSTLRLARWRLRHTWRLLLGAGLGMVAAVMIVCAVPFFSLVTTSAGLRGIFTADPARDSISVHISTLDTPVENVQQIDTLIDTSMQTHLGPTLSPGKQISAQLSPLRLLSASQGGVSRDIYNATMQVISYDDAQLASHATVLMGRLPQSGATNLEIALSQLTAASLGVKLGATLTLNSADDPGVITAAYKVPLTVVGIIGVKADDPFFHRFSFDPQPLEHSQIFYQVLTANAALLTLLQSPAANTPGGRLSAQLYWYYALDPARLDTGTLGTVIDHVNALEIELPNALLALDGSPRGSIQGDALATLTDYQARISTLQVPLTFVLVLILAYILFFVSVLAEIIVDRQADAIAVLRSRGVSRPQIFGALVTQSLGLSAIALIVGPLLALMAVVVLSQHVLPPTQQGTLTLLTAHPLQTAYGAPLLAILAVVAALGAMIIAINRATSADVLTMRLDAARTTRKPIWQRLNLDVAAAIIAFTGSLLYSLVVSRINPTVQYQLGFLGLVAPTFLLIAGTLLFFRLYPLLLHGAAGIAGRGRGAVVLLALAQMARAPRQSLRTTLLLALSTALMVFTLIFVTSETQHLRDVASFNAGADFSGALPPYATAPVAPIGELSLPYSQIPGVTSAALGYETTLPPSAGAVNATNQLIAVDAEHYAQAATWDARNSTQSLASLMAQLVSQRSGAKSNLVIPAILNGTMWDALHLTPGGKFSFSVPGYDYGMLRFVAIARVEHIQGVYDATQFVNGGMLVDYQSYTTVLADVAGVEAPYPPNVIWVRSANDAASLASVHTALTTGKLKLASLVDRRALTQSLIADPLQVDLSGILTVGAIAALVLALVGVLTASWLNARSRLTNFAVLRALGSMPRQIAGVLIWEQSIVYSVALILGGLLGALLAVMLLPVLAFANAHTNRGDLIGAANLPAIQTIAPVGALAWAMGALVVICIGALVFMTLIVARPSVSATLRLNED